MICQEHLVILASDLLKAVAKDAVPQITVDVINVYDNFG